MTTANQKISQLYPNELWAWFEQISSIPHPSKHEQALSQHIQNWAKNNNIACVEDKVGNLILRKSAFPGYENKKLVCLQAHLDMVPQKNSDVQHDFTTDPIQLRIDGDWVKATNTTLGADNGIGMASALAILGSTNIPHGPLEVLLTIDEEAGMTGAFGLEAGVLNAEILINTDSEQEGEIYMGCAGGVNAEFTLPINKQIDREHEVEFDMKLSGLKGGHSGVNIHLGRGNANKLIARFFIQFMSDINYSISELSGGSLRNAIPREARVRFNADKNHAQEIEARVSKYLTLIKSELSLVEPEIALSLTQGKAANEVWSEETQRTILNLIHACPNGVIRMNDAIPGVTETSINVGVITSHSDHIEILCLVRSLIDSGREYVESVLKSIATFAGASIQFSGAYPGWKPDPSSPVMAIVNETYRDIYKKDPVIMVIHAGLECGLFKKHYPNLDMVSIGPTIRFPHSPDEMVQISTVGQYWDLLLALLKRIPDKE